MPFFLLLKTNMGLFDSVLQTGWNIASQPLQSLYRVATGTNPHVGNRGYIDVGASELVSKALQQPTTYQGGSNLFGAMPSAPPTGGGGGQITPTAWSTNQPSTGTGTRTTSSYSAPATSGFTTGMSNINQNAGDQNAIIDQEYNQAMSEAAGQENLLRSQAGATSGEIDTQASGVKTQLGREQQTQTQGVEQQLGTAEQNRSSGLQAMRDAFRQISGENTAKMSALGISSSSVAEALAENLGVETARRIAGITGTANEIRQNVTKELSNINNYFEEKKTGVEQWVANEKVKLQNALLAGLNQINAARNQAASAKAQARAGLLADVRNSIYNLSQQQQQFEQSLQQWREQKAATLTPYSNPQFLQQYLANFQQLQNWNQQGGMNLDIGGTYGVNSSGMPTGSYNLKPKQNTDEDLSTPAGWQTQT